MFDLIIKLNIFAQVIIGTIVLILFINIVLSLKLRSNYKRLLEDIEDRENRENKLFEFPIFNSMIRNYKHAKDRNIEDINTLSIVDKNIHKSLSKSLLGERIINKSTSLMIILGLIGTFYGLTLSIGELVNLLTNAGEAVVGNVSEVTDGLILAVRSMSVAFITSLFGITSSIIVTVIKIIIDIPNYRENLMISSEEYLDNYLARQGKKLDDMNSDGKTNLEVAFDSFGSVIETNLKEVTSELSFRLTNSSKEMSESAEIIKESIDKFDLSLDKFNDNVRDFSEFNYHLKTNIERMSVAFEDLTTDLKSNRNNKHFISLASSIEKLSESVK